MRITKMKDGSTHMARKAEHAVDMQTGAVMAVTLQAADQGDTATVHETPRELKNRGRDAFAELIWLRIALLLLEKALESHPQSSHQLNPGHNLHFCRRYRCRKTGGSATDS
jgi:phage gp29-like protein